MTTWEMTAAGRHTSPAPAPIAVPTAESRRFPWAEVVGAGMFFTLASALYWLSNPTPPDWYKHEVFQAAAFLDGRLDVRGVPDHYHDLVPFHGRVYLPFPPGPALLLVPLVAVWGTAFPASLFAHLLGGAAVAVTWLLLGTATGLDWRRRVYVTVLFGAGTVLWSAAQLGTTWFFAHLCGVLFCLFALWAARVGRSGWLVALLFAFAYLSRVPMLMAAPLFLTLLGARHATVRSLFSLSGGGRSIPVLIARLRAVWQDVRARNDLGGFVLVSLAAGLGVFAFNQARFGNPLEAGESYHGYATHFVEPLKFGMISVRHLPDNIHALLFRGFDLVGEAPFLRPDPGGLSVLLVTPPILRLVFPAAPHDRRRWGYLATALAVLFPSLLWFATGWVQWGYRYLLDAWPFLLLVLVHALPAKPSRTDWALLVLAISSNALGAYWISTLGW